jgi:hypothetical protein
LHHIIQRYKSAFHPSLNKQQPRLETIDRQKIYGKESNQERRRKKKYVYSFGAGKADGDGSMKALLGGKGANLAEMSRIGLPVPPGFTISTEVCTYFYANKKTYPADLQKQMEAGVRIHGEDHGLQVRRRQRHAAACCRALRRS